MMFSLQVYKSEDSVLPVDGGFKSDGKLTTDDEWTQEFNIARDYHFKL